MTGTSGDSPDQSGPAHANPGAPSHHHGHFRKVRNFALFNNTLFT